MSTVVDTRTHGKDLDALVGHRVHSLTLVNASVSLGNLDVEKLYLRGELLGVRISPHHFAGNSLH
jgi:hypothetical protein